MYKQTVSSTFEIGQSPRLHTCVFVYLLVYCRSQSNKTIENICRWSAGPVPVNDTKSGPTMRYIHNSTQVLVYTVWTIRGCWMGDLSTFIKAKFLPLSFSSSTTDSGPHFHIFMSDMGGNGKIKLKADLY